MTQTPAQQRHSQRMYEQRDAHLGHLPGQILLDVARNEAAPREWRKAAVQIMLDKNCHQASHPDLAFLVIEIQAEAEAKAEVESVVESAIEGPLQVDTAVPTQVLPAEKPLTFHIMDLQQPLAQIGPFKASVTTASLFT